MKRAAFLLLGLSGCAGVDCYRPVQMVPVVTMPVQSSPVIVGRPQADCVDDVVSTPVESGPAKAATDLSPVPPSTGSPLASPKTPNLEPIPKG